MVLSMDRWVGKVAIVTGASSGIGAAIAERLVKEGLIVVGLARRKERLDDLTKKLAGNPGTFHGFKTDMSQEEDILNAFKWVLENHGPVHILVNNAGVGKPTNLTNGDTEMWRTTLEVNVLGLCIATREALRIMKDNNITGHIIHMNSILGHRVPIHAFLQSAAHSNVYPASKFAVTALTETLRVELNCLSSKTKITSLSPGLVNTEIFEANNITPSALSNPKIKFVLQPEDVADAVVYVLSTPPHVQVLELTIKPINEKY